jgi:hypothetical protein
MNSSHPSTDLAKHSQTTGERAVLVIGTIGFAVSSGLLLWAATHRERAALWIGIIDVALAFGLVILAAWVDRRAAGRITARTLAYSHRIAAHLPPLVLLALWMGRHQFDFNFLTGVAWRLWLLLYVLPAALAIWKSPKATDSTDYEAQIWPVKR